MELIKILKFLYCPCCFSQLFLKNKKLICSHCRANFKVVDNVPILIDKSNPHEFKQIKFFNKHYAAFASDYKLENWRLSMLKRLFSVNITCQKMKYLDIGCGATGYTVIEAAKKYQWLSFGIDISLPAILKARNFARQQGVENKTVFIVASAQNLPFKKNLFDYVSAISVIEHLVEDENFVNSVFQVLKNKGFLFICTPNAYKKIWPFFWPFYYYFDRQVGHQRHYSVKSLSEKFEKNHLFKIKKVFYNGHLLKLWQLFCEKFNLIDNYRWWQWEQRDINSNPWALQLNAILQKTCRSDL